MICQLAKLSCTCCMTSYMYVFFYRWPSFRISAQKLCSGDWERTLRFSVWDWDSDGTHDFIGEGTASLRDITPER